MTDRDAQQAEGEVREPTLLMDYRVVLREEYNALAAENARLRGELKAAYACIRDALQPFYSDITIDEFNKKHAAPIAASREQT